MKRKVIIDCDTGSDDAVAIMLAALNPQIELVAVCTVKGNQELENVTENTKKVLDLLHSDIPLYKGCKEPFVKNAASWQIQYENRATVIGLDGKPHFIHEDFNMLPDSNRKVEDKPAAIFLSEYFNGQNDPTTLVCVGPLTNIATALSINPDIAKNIEELVIMGGGDDEANATSCSEFNFFFDPEAAQKVFQAGIKRMTIIPLDCTHKVMVTKDDCARFEEIGTPAAKFANQMCEKRIEVHTQCQPLTLPDSCALHDPVCIAYLIDETVLEDVRHYHVDCSLAGLTYGAMVIDHRFFQDNRNAYIAYNGDRKKFVDILCDAFKLNS